MSDQNIDPVELIKWMWDHVMQDPDRKWITFKDTNSRTSAEVLELYKQSINTDNNAA